MNSGRKEGDIEYDKRTAFGCTPGAGASGHNGARDDFDLLWSWLAARLRGPPRNEPHERAIEFRAEPGAGGLHGSVSLARFRLRALPHSGQGRPEPGAATAGSGRGDRARSEERRVGKE